MALGTLKERQAAKKAIEASGQKFTADNYMAYQKSQAASQPTTQKTPSMLSNAVDAVKGAAGAAKTMANQTINKIQAVAPKQTPQTQPKSVLGQTPSMTSAFTLPEKDKTTAVTPQTQGEQLRFEATPAPKPTVATPEQPVMSITATDNKVAGTTPQTDRERMIAITAKQVRAAGGHPELTDEELNFMIDSQLPKDQTSTMQAGQDALNQQIADEEARMAATETRLLSENEQKLADYSAKLEKEYGIAMDKARENGEARKEETRRSMSFSGFGRSTANMEKLDTIQKDINTQIDLLESTKEAEKKAYEMQLAGATAEQMEGIRSQISSMRTSASQMAVDVAMATAEMNAANQVSTSEAIANMMSTIPSNSVEQRAFDADASEAFGFISDEFGNPLQPDENGNGIPYAGVDNTKWSMYIDPNTSLPVYWDPMNPGRTYMTPGSQQTYKPYTDQTGMPSSAPDTYTGDAVDVTDMYPSDRTKFAGNCVKWARQEVNTIPMDAWDTQDRIRGIKEAEAQGLGSADMTQVQVGDAIHTSEGTGHTAIVRGFTQDGQMILEEANYTPGRITYGRTLPINSKVNLGWIRDPKNQGVNTFKGGIDKGLNFLGMDQTDFIDNEEYKPQASVTEKIGVDKPSVEFTPGQMKMFADDDKPQFIGSKDDQKEQQAEWRKNKEIFHGMVARGEVSLKDYDPIKWEARTSEFDSSDYNNDLKAFETFNSNLDKYMDIFNEEGFVEYGVNAKLAEALHARLLMQQKNIDKLGVLTGPDVDLVTRQIPVIWGLDIGAKSALKGGEAGVKNVLDDLAATRQKAYNYKIQDAEQTWGTINDYNGLTRFRRNYDSKYGDESSSEPQGANDTGYQEEELDNGFDDFYNNL